MTIENTNNAMIHEVFGVTETNEIDVYIVDLELTDMDGERYRCDYCSRPDDTFGLAPAVRQWLTDNPSFPVAPYVAPTAEQIRAGMQPITPRQLRLALVRNGTSLASVTAALEASGDEEAMIEWEYATTFDRTATALLIIAASLGLTPSEVDTLWAIAATI